MNQTAAALLDQAGRYAHLFDAAAVALPAETSSAAPIRLSSDQELVQGLAAVSRLIRLAEAERIRLAGEIARRSAGRDPEASLARRLGTANAGDLVAQVSGVRREQAGSTVRLAIAVHPREAITGELLEPEHPHIAEALEAGHLDPVVAGAMVRAIRKSAPGLTPAEALALEAQLVERALDGHTADELLAFCKQVPDFAHPEGAEAREQRLVASASITRRALDNGLTRWVLDLDPLTAGLFQTALDAKTAQTKFRLITPDQTDDEAGRDEAAATGADPAAGGSTPADGADRSTGGPADPAGKWSSWSNPGSGTAPAGSELDRRPLKERRIDGLRLLANTVLQVDDGHVGGTAVTMVVHIGKDELLTGLGAATIDGIEGTISAATARKLACEAEILPLVLGGDSQPLDLGMGRRIFSEAQRRAMAARDRGCAGPGCDAPVSWTQAAHIRPAGYGKTSVENGILLCPRCHHLLDDHGWQVRREGPRWWWTPPPHIDFLRTPRPGGPVPPLRDVA